MRLFHFHCTQFVSIENKKECIKTKYILDIINNWFINKTLSSSRNCKHQNQSNKKEIFLIKLQIEQFWTDHYLDFINYMRENYWIC